MKKEEKITHNTSIRISLKDLEIIKNIKKESDRNENQVLGDAVKYALENGFKNKYLAYKKL